MTTLFIDTNIVLDLLAQREPFYQDAASLFSLADKDKVLLLVSSLTFANTYYVLRKLKGTKNARDILTRFKVLVKVVALTDKVVELALSDQNFNDFEDGLQYYSAIGNDAVVIITRNLKDFKHSNIPVLSAKSFLSQWE